MIASGAVHFTGNLDPCFGQYSSSAMTRAKPKSQIFAILFSPIKTFRAAKSLFLIATTTKKQIRFNEPKLIDKSISTCVLIVWILNIPFQTQFVPQYKLNLRIVNIFRHLLAKSLTNSPSTYILVQYK